MVRFQKYVALKRMNRQENNSEKDMFGERGKGKGVLERGILMQLRIWLVLYHNTLFQKQSLVYFF